MTCGPTRSATSGRGLREFSPGDIAALKAALSSLPGIGRPLEPAAKSHKKSAEPNDSSAPVQKSVNLVATAVLAATATATAAWRALGFRPGFVHGQITATHRRAVESVDCLLCLFRRRHRDKSEPAGTA